MMRYKTFKTHMNLIKNEYEIVWTHESKMISYLIDNEIILFLKNIVKYSIILNQVRNHTGFMCLLDTVFILYQIHVNDFK